MNTPARHIYSNLVPYQQTADNFGAIKVFIPCDRQPFGSPTADLSDDVKVWLDQQVGPRYSSIPALFQYDNWPGYVALRSVVEQRKFIGSGYKTVKEFLGWDFYFRSTHHAMLFKLTWL